MTITAQQPKIVYALPSVSDDFPISFFFYEEADLHVYHVENGIEEELTSGFTVIQTQADAYLNFPSPPRPSSGNLVILRKTPQEQNTTYPEGGQFPSKTVETDFDRSVALIQELAEADKLNIKAPVDGSIDPNDLTRALFEAAQESVQARDDAQTAAQESTNQANRAQNIVDAGQTQITNTITQGLSSIDSAKNTAITDVGALVGQATSQANRAEAEADRAASVASSPDGMTIWAAAGISHAAINPTDLVADWLFKKETPGAATFTVPASGIYEIHGHGVGGTGGYAESNVSGVALGAGGGAGGYFKGYFKLAAGAVVNITVGTPGAPNQVTDLGTDTQITIGAMVVKATKGGRGGDMSIGGSYSACSMSYGDGGSSVLQNITNAFVQSFVGRPGSPGQFSGEISNAGASHWAFGGGNGGSSLFGRGGNPPAKRMSAGSVGDGLPGELGAGGAGAVSSNTFGRRLGGTGGNGFVWIRKVANLP